MRLIACSDLDSSCADRATNSSYGLCRPFISCFCALPPAARREFASLKSTTSYYCKQMPHSSC
jgi:hypothetical protein